MNTPHDLYIDYLWDYNIKNTINTILSVRFDHREKIWPHCQWYLSIINKCSRFITILSINTTWGTFLVQRAHSYHHTISYTDILMKTKWDCEQEVYYFNIYNSHRSFMCNPHINVHQIMWSLIHWYSPGFFYWVWTPLKIRSLLL